MFCPLCKSEYREGVARCDGCGAALLASLESAAARANPAMTLWRGKDDAVFAAFTEALSDAGIPWHGEEPPRVSLGRKWLPEASVEVLRSDFTRALNLAKQLWRSSGERLKNSASCYACRERILPGFSQCYLCGAVLRVPAEEALAMGEAYPKWCPLCKLTYPAAYAECTQCGAELLTEAGIETVSVRPASGDRKQAEQGRALVVIWREDDPAAFSRVQAALRGAGIAHYAGPTRDHLSFGLGMPRPMYEVRVLESDAEAAHGLVAEIRGTLPFEAPKALQIVADSSARGGDVLHRFPDRDLSEAVVQVWAGDDPAIAETLRACLFENRILLREVGFSPGRRELYVCPDQEEAARRIVGEVTHGRR